MKRTQSGYIVLLFSIIVTTVGVLLALNAAVVSSQTGKNNIAIRESQQAETLARRCTEITMSNLQKNRYYEGDESLTLPNGDECYVYAISGVGNGPRTIVTSGEDSTSIRYLETKLISIAPTIQIASQNLIVSPEDSSDPEFVNLATNSPTQIDDQSPNLWLRAATLNATNNARIEEWTDTFNDITLSQTTESDRPRYLNRVKNGRPGVSFTPEFMTGPLAYNSIIGDANKVILGVMQLESTEEAVLVTTATDWDPEWTVITNNDIYPLNRLQPNGIMLELMIYIPPLSSDNQDILQTYLTTKYDL